MRLRTQALTVQDGRQRSRSCGSMTTIMSFLIRPMQLLFKRRQSCSRRCGGRWGIYGGRSISPKKTSSGTTRLNACLNFFRTSSWRGQRHDYTPRVSADSSRVGGDARGCRCCATIRCAARRRGRPVTNRSASGARGRSGRTNTTARRITEW